jgi:hypothetical protein
MVVGAFFHARQGRRVRQVRNTKGRTVWVLCVSCVCVCVCCVCVLCLETWRGSKAGSQQAAVAGEMDSRDLAPGDGAGRGARRHATLGWAWQCDAQRGPGAKLLPFSRCGPAGRGRAAEGGCRWRARLQRGTGDRQGCSPGTALIAAASAAAVVAAVGWPGRDAVSWVGGVLARAA